MLWYDKLPEILTFLPLLVDLSPHHGAPRFLYAPVSNSLWCKVAKAGSTTYISTILRGLHMKAGHSVDDSNIHRMRCF